jgi:L-alanine-DL-glutamate epimerase-like enolase superfamily enzyme
MSGLKITDIETIILDVPFHPIPTRVMERGYNGWHIVEMCRVTTDAGLVGWGETLPHYTWGRVTPEAIARAKGQNPADLMWDETLGAGLQMALFDVVGKAAGVPVYRLLGNKVRDWCPVSWWSIDQSAEECALEAARAVSEGYLSYKQKARPWFDPWEQARRTAEVVPAHFKLDFDFNETLLNAGQAVAVLKDLEDHCPNISIFESPIIQNDMEGNRRIRQQIRSGLALHYNYQLMEAVRAGALDGFVNDGSPNKILRQARLAEEANLPFWLQMVGTAWTTAMSLHLGAVCTQAQWPAVTCMNLYVDQLVTQPLKAQGGMMRVPEAPGLGLEFNEAALKWRVDSIDKPNVRALYAIVRPHGERLWYKGEVEAGGYWEDAMRGNLPMFERGTRLERWDDDGTPEWHELRRRVEAGPVRSQA